jgi:alpha-ketoglutarate-dependent taurine dioxygenase
MKQGNAAMGLQITKLNPHFGVEISGIDLRTPLTPALRAEIERAYHDATVVLFRDQDLSPDEQIAFSRGFGDLNIHVHQRIVPGKAEVIVLSNLLDEDGKPVGSFNCALSWHTDGTHLQTPVTGSLLYCVVAPDQGGETEFAGTAAAYDDLPAALKAEIEGKQAIHSYVLLAQRSFPDRPIPDAKKREIPDILQPLVRVHPHTGRKALYLGEHVIAGVAGMPTEAGVALVTRLREHATQAKYVYRHKWRRGDLLMWDNRASLHRALYLDHENQKRRLHRTTINGDELTGVPVRAGTPAAAGALNPLSA